MLLIFISFSSLVFIFVLVLVSSTIQNVFVIFVIVFVVVDEKTLVKCRLNRSSESVSASHGRAVQAKCSPWEFLYLYSDNPVRTTAAPGCGLRRAERVRLSNEQNSRCSSVPFARNSCRTSLSWNDGRRLADSARRKHAGPEANGSLGPICRQLSNLSRLVGLRSCRPRRSVFVESSWRCFVTVQTVVCARRTSRRRLCISARQLTICLASSAGQNPVLTRFKSDSILLCEVSI